MFDFHQSGNGPALLFLPGSYGHHSAWREVQSHLSDRYRLISTSLPGYGRTEETRSNSTNDMSGMVRFVERLVEEIAQPIHLIGHSFGGLTAIAAVLDGSVKPESMITFEANPLYARPDIGIQPFESELHSLTRRFRSALAAEDPDAAAIIIDFYSKPGTFQSMPDAFRDYCRACAPTNDLDWLAAEGFCPPYSRFAKIDMPFTVVRGEHAIPAITNISEQLSYHAPRSQSRIVQGANHFLITTHARECAAIIDAHMQELI